MKVLIAGAGNVGRSIANDLCERHYEVTIVEHDPQAMRTYRVPEAHWVLADACEVAKLKKIPLDEMDVVVAATGDDKVNLVLSLLAKTEFGIPRVVARVNNPANEWLFNDSWGVDFAVSTPRIMTMIVDDAVSTGELTRRLEFEDSQASIYQALIASKSCLVGKRLHQLPLPQSFFVSGIIRNGIPLPADPAFLLEPNDRLIFLAYDPLATDLVELNALTTGESSEKSTL